MTMLVRDARRRDHFARDARSPERLAVGVEREHVALVGADDDERCVGARSRRQRVARADAPRHASRCRVDAHQRAVGRRGVDRGGRDRRRESGPRLADALLPVDLRRDLRVEGRQRARLVASAGEPRERRRGNRGHPRRERRLRQARAAGADRCGEQRACANAQRSRHFAAPWSVRRRRRRRSACHRGGCRTRRGSAGRLAGSRRRRGLRLRWRSAERVVLHLHVIAIRRLRIELRERVFVRAARIGRAPGGRERVAAQVGEHAVERRRMLRIERRQRLVVLLVVDLHLREAIARDRLQFLLRRMLDDPRVLRFRAVAIAGVEEHLRVKQRGARRVGGCRVAIGELRRSHPWPSPCPWCAPLR